MAEEYRNGSCGSILMAFVLGAAIGGGLALLTAPRSGQETRDKFREMSDELLEKTKKSADEAEARIRAAIDEGREVLAEKKEIIKSAIEAGREAMEAERSKHKETA
jgi:gas vesicle protein